MSYIIFQIFFFCFLLYWVFKQNKSGVSKIILVEWLISCIFTYVYTYFRLETDVDFDFLPVLYWDVCYLIYLFPVLGIEVRKIDASDKFVEYSIIFLMFLGILSLLPFYENLVYLIKNYAIQSSTILEIYEDKMDVYNKANLVTWLSPISVAIQNLILKFNYSALIIFFIIISKREYISNIKLLLFACYFFNSICYSLNYSGRGAFVEFALVASVFYLIFRDIIVLRISTIAKVSFLSGLIGATICLLILTVIRVGSDSDNVEYWLSASLYLGEGQVNFFEHMWNCKASAQGDYNFSFIKDILGLDTFTDYLRRREYWCYSRVGYDPVRFYTFIGGLFADLRYYTILFILFLSYFFYRMLRKCDGKYSLLSLYMIYVYLDILVMGFSIFNFMVYSKMRQVIVNVLYLFIFIILTNERTRSYNHKYGGKK